MERTQEWLSNFGFISQFCLYDLSKSLDLKLAMYNLKKVAEILKVVRIYSTKGPFQILYP